MNVIIVEDEVHARENLIRLLLEIQPDITIQAQMDTVSDTVHWLKQNKTDLIFLDIQLADDLCFKIFEQIEVLTPVIFITAYDKYMMQSFEVNNVYYLLKPLHKNKLAQALKKYKTIHQKTIAEDYTFFSNVLEEAKKKVYKTRLIVTIGKRMASIKTKDIAYFEAQDKDTFVVTKNKRKYYINEKLKKLDDDILDPKYFFRVNRSFIVHIDAITNIVQAAKTRAILTLAPLPTRPTIVSTDKMPAFKAWLEQ